MMKIPETKVGSNSYPEIPRIKIDSKIWATGKLGDPSFVQRIQFLIQSAFIKLPKTQAQNQAVNHLVSPTVWFAPTPEKKGESIS